MSEITVPTKRDLAEMAKAGQEISKGIEEEISSLHQLDARKRAGEFFLFFSLYALGAALVPFLSGGWYVIPLILMALCLNSLGILLHEGLHGILAQDRTRNHLLSFMVGLPLMMSASAYRATHQDHHIDLGRGKDYGTYAQHVHSTKYVWIAYYLQLFFGSFLYVALIPFLGFHTSNARVRRIIVLELLIIATVFVLMFQWISWSGIARYWFYPILLTNVLTNIRGLASHALGDVEDVYLCSRTVYCSPVVEFIFLHENYHLEHHLFPQVPSYHLRELHHLIRHKLPRALESTSYATFLFEFLKAGLTLDVTPRRIRYASQPVTAIPDEGENG